MRVDIEGAERLEELEHLLNAFTYYQRHLVIAELEQVRVSCGTRHEHGPPAIESIDQRVVNIKDDVQAWAQTFLHYVPRGNWRLVLDSSLLWSVHL